MSESTEEIFTYKNAGSHYRFFEFVMIVLDTVFFGDGDELRIEDTQSIVHYNWDVHNELVLKFNPRTYNSEGSTGLTLVQFLTLMSATDRISKLLLSPEGETLKQNVLVRMPDLVDDWDTDFLKNAQVMFDNFNKMFQHLPEYGALLKLVTGA